MNDFIDVEISSLGTTITGKTPSSRCPEDYGEEFMFITPSDNFDVKTIDSTSRYLSEEGLNKLSKKVIPAENIMVTCIGSAMGKVAKNKTLCITNQQINSIVVDERFDSDYIYYLLTNNYKLLRNAATGSTALPLLNKTDFDALRVKIHSNKELRKRIAKVLSDLDAKIELNNKINAELEAMAKLIYDYWFVQFDFPDKNGKPYKSSGGKMVYNEELKREIPEGWEVKPIGSFINVKDGTHDSPKSTEEGYKLITSKHLKVGGLDFENANYISEEDYININKRSKVDTGDILFSMIGNIGTVYKVEEKEIDFTIKNVALYKTSECPNYKNYIYLYLNGHDMERYMGNVIAGSIQKFIGLGSLRKMPLLINDTHVGMFDETTKSIFSKMENLRLENLKLAELRDWLLPMLMNGQVTVN